MMWLNQKSDKNNSRTERHDIPDPGTSSAPHKSENRRLCHRQSGKNQPLFQKNFFDTSHSIRPYILSRLSSCLPSNPFLSHTMQKYFPSYCLPIPELQWGYFFSLRQASSCFLDQFHNIVQARRSITICTCIHAENNARS